MRASIRTVLGAVLLLGLPNVVAVVACGGTSQSPPGGGANAAGVSGVSQSTGGGDGGSSARGGAGGAGSSDVGPQQTANKLDVLFVIDNSSSMAGKQKILAASVPAFLTQLSGLASDIHLGVITTSLGSHGGNNVCLTSSNPHNDDQAQLIPSKREGIASYMGSGYLAFDSAGLTGVADSVQVSADLAAMINAAGEDGCGYEAQLEAMYRFLVDPEPPTSIEQHELVSTPTGINDTLLKQRSAFLRPDSSVAIVILSDENDCSIIDKGQGWLMTTGMRFPLATSACATNPNDPCCRSCAEAEAAPPAGCTAVAEDSVCKSVPTGQAATLDMLHDSLNLRCFDQQRRFGFDLLQPIERYKKGLSDAKITNRAGALIDNPLFAARDGKGPRSASLISVSVIVGAPWQDLATPESLSASKLQFLDGAGLEGASRWPLLLGDPGKNQAPSDPFMIESTGPRSGTNPLTQAAIAPPSSLNPTENAINGHEQNVPDLDDLQYACTFPLLTPIVCEPGAVCECAADKSGQLDSVLSANSPLCQPPAGGPPGTTQYYGKGYPGGRELAFARAMGSRAVAGSVCTKPAPQDATEVGYAAALNALTTRLAVTLK